MSFSAHASLFNLLFSFAKREKNNNLLSSSWQTFLGPSVQAVLVIVQTIWHRFRRLHIKLARRARALKEKNCIGNVKLQLAVTKEALWLFDQAQERRNLNQIETTFKAKLKDIYLGLLTLDRMKAIQRSRLTNISADANSKLFYFCANGRKRKKHIPILRTPQGLAISHEDKEDEIACHFSGLLGTEPHRSLSHPVLKPKPDAHRMYVQDQVVIYTTRM
jgi:hypothetical protein